MNRKVLGALVGVAVVAVAVWMLFLRGGGEAKVARQGTHAAGRHRSPARRRRRNRRAPRLAGPSPRVALDLDPEGPLRLEGQVQGETGEPSAARP